VTAVLAIARNTFREAIRDKVLYALLFFALLGLCSTLVLGEMSVGEQERLTRDLGLAGLSLFGVLIAIFLGVSLLYKELERKTVYAILPKPVRRAEFVLGKFAGMVATLSVIVALMAGVLCALLLMQRASPDGALLRAMALCLFEVVVVTAVAVFFSSWSSPFLSGLLTLGVFLLGRNADEFGALAAQVKSIPAKALLRALAVGLPNLNLFYPSGSDVDGRHVSVHGTFVDWSYVGVAAAYALLYTIAAVGLATLLFRRRDLV
jgi:ABC-type transport system involved in multi-copper enzyme maturation permease subunit